MEGVGSGRMVGDDMVARTAGCCLEGGKKNLEVCLFRSVLVEEAGEFDVVWLRIGMESRSKSMDNALILEIPSSIYSTLDGAEP